MLADLPFNGQGRIFLEMFVVLLLQQHRHLLVTFYSIHDHGGIAFVRREDDNPLLFVKAFDGFLLMLVQCGAGPSILLSMNLLTFSLSCCPSSFFILLATSSALAMISIDLGAVAKLRN